jgi:hypothetical protein
MTQLIPGQFSLAGIWLGGFSELGFRNPSEALFNQRTKTNVGVWWAALQNDINRLGF